MYFPIVDIIKKAYDRVFIWVGYLFWWHSLNRQMVRECEKGIGNPIESYRKESKWLVEHKASKWVWFDYWCGTLRGLLVCGILIVIIIERMVTICGY
jgi:hypothetical protein